MKQAKNKLHIVETSESSDEYGKSLNRIKGQVEGITQMLQAGRKAEDVLTQLAAVRAAVRSVEMKMLESHIREALAHAVADGGSDKTLDTIEDLMALLQKRLG